jgi:aspartate/methionine/tyrosine aminotransferase
MIHKLLTPFSAHNINMQVFFQDVADMVMQREKEIYDKRKRELNKNRDSVRMRIRDMI